MIKLQKVSKVFGDNAAVDNISFEVKEGEIFGLIGTSGCGKTTTLKMINHLVEPTSGQIFVNGISITDQPAVQLRRNIGYVIQDVGLFPHYTIGENIATVPKLMNWGEERVSRRSHELLEMVGLEPGKFASRSPDALSGGQQQRVGLARALAADPGLLLMDEPFGALDPITKDQVRKEFKKLLEELDKTVILVTHDVFEAFDLCDRICLMDAGKVRQTGTPKQLLFYPDNDFVHSFFDNHRLQLEMMSVTIKEIWKVSKGKEKEAGEVQPPDDKEGETISFSDSFQSVFTVAPSGKKIYSVLNERGETVGEISVEELLQGFQQLRDHWMEAGDD